MKRARPVNRSKPNKKSKDDFWKIPEIWRGETVFVVGGGPSLLKFDFNRLDGQRIVAINLAFTKMPFAQFCFFADNRFWDWHTEALLGFKHHVVTTARTIKPPHPHFHRIQRSHDHSKWFSFDQDIVMGKDSGVQAINLAYHLGAQRMVLLGFDMSFKELTSEEKIDRRIKHLQMPHVTRTAKRRPAMNNETHLAHWYQEHPIPSREQNYVKRFLPQYSEVYKIVKAEGREMFLGSPSAIDCIPHIDLSELLGEQDETRMGIDPGQAALSV